MSKGVYILILSLLLSITAKAEDRLYNIKNALSIAVSDNLELREADGAYTKFLEDTMCYYSKAEVVFQQRDLSSKQKEALDRYCRIMIQIDDEGNGEYPCCNNGNFSESDIDELEALARQELGPDQKFIVMPKDTIETNDYGVKFLRIYYERTGYKGDVCVNMCFFFNYNYAAKIIFSYRKSESEIWKNSIVRTINSFKWRNPFKSSSYSSIGETSEESSNGNNHDFTIGIIVGYLVLSMIFVISLLLNRSAKHRRHEDIKSSLKQIEELTNRDKINSAENIISKIKQSITSNHSEFQSALDDAISKIEERKEEISCQADEILRSSYQQLKEGQIEKAKTLVRMAEVMVSDELPNNIKNKIQEKVQIIEKEYEEGIVPIQDIVHVNYNIPLSIPVVPGCYFDLYWPRKSSIVFPYRRSKVEKRGYTEEQFESRLRSSMSDMTNYKVLGDVSILPNEGCHPYEPDIAIIENISKLGIRIDIEIDEPYSGFDKSPIHFVGCGDEYRDKNLSNMGWIVLRFSERQVFKDFAKCISLIRFILSTLDNKLVRCDFVSPKLDKHWTKVEAQMMIIRKSRENLLNHEFGIVESSPITKRDVTQTEVEKKAAQEVSPWICNAKPPKNIDSSDVVFSNDKLISFESNEHVYVYDGHLELTPVSTAISYFFNPFDSIRLSASVARRDERNQCEVMEEWDSNGKESREIGTFLHAQIDAFLNGQEISDEIYFSYEGEYISENKSVSIATELKYFEAFISENPILPFRTEWHIFDLKHKIAGTIDLLCRNGESYEMYDWKRSKRACPDETIWSYGINGLEHIPDIIFYHYALQQNIYKYILEKNYGIYVKNMYIVVLHPIYDTYKKFQIPNMASEVKTILNIISSL